jgi:antitoxin YefM
LIAIKGNPQLDLPNVGLEVQNYETQTMLDDIPITEARHELTSLPERLAEEPGAVAITRRGRPVLAIMPWDLYESIIETLEILGDEELMVALRQVIQEAEAGQGIPWEQARQQLEL